MLEYIQLIDAYLIGIGLVLAGLLAIAKLTPTETDNKIVNKLIGYVNKVKEVTGKLIKPKAK